MEPVAPFLHVAPPVTPLSPPQQYEFVKKIAVKRLRPSSNGGDIVEYTSSSSSESDESLDDDESFPTKPPPGARLLQDGLSSCPRFTFLHPSDLRLLDTVFTDTAKQEITPSQSDSLNYLLEDEHKLRKAYADSHYSWMYRVCSRSRIFSYFFLTAVRKDKNHADNTVCRNSLRERVVEALAWRRWCGLNNSANTSIVSESETSERPASADTSEVDSSEDAVSDLASTSYRPSMLEEPCKTPFFVVIGWFPDSNPVTKPIETCVIVDNLENFLPDLKKHIPGVRGWRWLLSFKSVHGFSIYKCRPRYLGHTIPDTSDDAALALEQLFRATDASYRRPHGTSVRSRIRRADSIAWAGWVHKNINNSRSSPFYSHRSIQLVLKWSAARIAIASSIPLAVSIAIGLWYHIAYDDIQGAWGLASFVITAGGFIIAVLGVLSASKDGKTGSAPRMRVLQLTDYQLDAILRDED